MAEPLVYFKVNMDPASPQAVTAWLTQQLLQKIGDRHPDQVVLLKGQRANWYKRYRGDTLVKIVSQNDDAVCKSCRDMIAHNPYRYEDARKQLPHHPGCRCQIKSLKASDTGYLRQPTFDKFGKYMQTAVKNAVKFRGRKTPQRGATIKKLRKKGRRFVAPSGYRASRIYTRGRKPK
jgi:hypothetical protein